jgi:pectin methylesterase-like acyl-CoA thioesterase
VINALTAQSVLPEPFGSIQKAVQATVVATATASNIAKIKATKFQGGGSVSAGGGGGVQGASASSFSIGDDTSSAQTMLNPDGTQSQSGNGQAVQVFVTETDISNVQQNVQQIDVRSTF